MTREELGITEAGADYIEAIIASGQHEKMARIHRFPINPWYEAEVERTRAIVRVECGVGDARDHELASGSSIG